MPGAHDSSKNGQFYTYFIENKDQREELSRLIAQDRTLTNGMGGPLAEQSPTLELRRILDIGCGPGGWLLELAALYPSAELVGIDISPRMIEYANAQAACAQIATRVTFQVMDALKPLLLPSAAFDLVNLRLGGSFLRTWDWPNLLSEVMRVTRSGGTIRLTDSENERPSTSPALDKLFALLSNALFQAGHIFTNDRTGLVSHLPRLLIKFGCLNVQCRTIPLEFRAGTPAGEAYYQNLARMQIIRSFIQKWTYPNNDFDELLQQALLDAHRSDFCVIWPLHTVWGTRP